MEFTHLKRQEKLFLTFYKIFYLTAAHLKSTYMLNHAEPVSTGADWQNLMVIKEL